jgi:hypothetical protein
MGYVIATSESTVSGGRVVAHNVQVHEVVGWDKSDCGEDGCYKPAVDCPKFRAADTTLAGAIQKATDWIELQERTKKRT